ncbi:MAG: homocysteine S-methyltransferase family protein [Firmicutes bacterium]|nr:homocysteine S-methyltransferase family protein [Bacillota bacterium]
MKNVRELLQGSVVLLDGAMGTMLQRGGLPAGERPELLNLSHPEQITAIHRAYVEQGAQIIYTNTFGANERKLAGTGASVEQVITAGVKAARAAAGENAFTALDVGPLGELLEPAGSLSFEEAYALFARQMTAGERAGADLIVVETMTDLYEVKAALLAAKENTKLPVFVTMTFEENGRTFTGCSVPAMALVCEGLGADAIGFNCSLGPDELFPIAEELSHWTSLPMIIKANAGLPDPATNEYQIDAAHFAASMERFLSLGVSLLGGCCGTAPEYLAALRSAVEGKVPCPRDYVPRAALCSPTRTVEIDGVRIIGERINPTGKKRFKQALLEKDMDYILAQGIAQAEAGAEILDVNVGLPEIDEPEMMRETVRRLQSVLELPLQLDSSDTKALEAGLRAYNGKPIVNSVNGEEKSLRTVLPLVKKYGAAVVGLTLDGNGIPLKAEQRFAIAEKILRAALSYGIRREDVYIDCLTLTASVQQAEVYETLRAVRMVKERLGLHTVLGVSNISFGLPNRELINRSFLLLAMDAGLDLPIINPNISAMTDTVAAFNVLANRDRGAVRFVEKYSLPAEEAAAPKTVQPGLEDPAQALGSAVRRGMRSEAAALTKELLKTREPMQIVDGILIPALDEVGRKFETGVLFLPQLLQAAQASQEAFSCIRDAIAAAGASGEDKGRIIVATVKGDIHDIGKNIVKTLLENYGFRVIDLGRDVPPETVLRAAQEQKVRLIGLSALMTTTLKSMEETITLLKREIPDCRVMVGGAVVTEDYAARIGADYYAQDARRSVAIAQEFFENT